MSTATTMLFGLLVASAADARQASSHPPLVAELGVKQAFENGVIELRGSDGWLRTPRVYLDFQITFEYQVAPDADAGFIFRTWVHLGNWPRAGYRLNLPKRAASNHDGLMNARQHKFSVLRTGRVDYRPDDQWQDVQVTGRGRLITILINGTLAAEYEVENFGGHLLFDNRRGVARFRNIKMSRLDDFGVIPADLSEGARKFLGAGGQSPKLLEDARPVYTPEAYYGGLEGLVELEVVVGADGNPGAIQIKKSLDPELDLSAIAAVKRWRFKPASLNGAAVPMVIAIEMTFSIGDRR